jgi:hypothetical protein
MARAMTAAPRIPALPGKGPLERTDVRFDGVLGYHVCDAMGGIPSFIERIGTEQLVEEEAALLAKGDLFPWPVAELVDRVRAAEATAYRIDSSIGFDGFVAARTMTIVER